MRVTLHEVSKGRGLLPESCGEAGERDARVGVGDGLGDRVEALRSDRDQLADQGLSVVEVAVEGAARQTGAAGDDVDRCARVGREGRSGRIEDSGAILDGVTAGSTGGHAPILRIVHSSVQDNSEDSQGLNSGRSQLSTDRHSEPLPARSSVLARRSC